MTPRACPSDRHPNPNPPQPEPEPQPQPQPEAHTPTRTPARTLAQALALPLPLPLPRWNLFRVLPKQEAKKTRTTDGSYVFDKPWGKQWGA